MALGPTIYKCVISLSDTDRQRYETLNLTIAKHPSETDVRMMVRLLAYCIHAESELLFSAGLSTPDEPDIKLASLDGKNRLWLDVGEPGADRLKKASRIADRVVVYSFNHKSEAWWARNGDSIRDNAEVFQIQWEDALALTDLISRRMTLGITIMDNRAYLSNDTTQHEVTWTPLSR